MRPAFIVLDLGNSCGCQFTAVVGPFGFMRAASTAAGDLEEEIPGSVLYVHHNAHGCVSQLPIPDQLARARVRLAEARARLQEGAA
jgi:hypothetical protein